MAESIPFWRRQTAPPQFDIRNLSPASLPKGTRFETCGDARALNISRHAKIEKADTAIAEMLRDCGRSSYVCDSPACALCARTFRVWLFNQLLEAAEQQTLGRGIITIYLASFREGQLERADLKKASAALRQRLNRAKMRGIVLIGGTELAYRAEEKDWVLHVHLLGLRLEPQHQQKIKTIVPGQSIPRPVKIQKISSIAKQVSYLQKFNTFHRPGRQKGNRRARPYPLPSAPFIELMQFYARSNFTDFLFLFGARRRGNRIVIETVPKKQRGRRLRAYAPTHKKRHTKKQRRRRE